jgi:hypothetical protein
MPVRLAAACLLLVAGCSFGEEDGATIEAAALERLVLQPEDLPRVFRRFDEGPQIQPDLPTGARSDPGRFGREAGWKARYRRSGTPRTRGALVVESRADLFESTSGADDELDAHRAEFETGQTGRGHELVDAPRIGDESFATTVSQPGTGGGGVRYFLIAWRDDNVTASVYVSGFERRLTLEQALGLARRQQLRITAAAE